MKKVIWFSCILTLILFVGLSCDKAVVTMDNVHSSQNTTLKQQALPPINEFVCGDPDPNSPYPCPNASCPYLGWDCFAEVLIYDFPTIDDYEDYLTVVGILDEYINHENTEEFFTEFSEEVEMIIPELEDQARGPILSDLQHGITSVRKHAVYDSVNNREIYIYQLYVVGTGAPPNYGDL